MQDGYCELTCGVCGALPSDGEETTLPSDGEETELPSDGDETEKTGEVHVKKYSRYGDCSGYDIGVHQEVADLDECKALCAETPGCNYYVFWRSNNQCFPKKHCPRLNTSSGAQT